jgi:hypothetical protein
MTSLLCPYCTAQFSAVDDAEAHVVAAHEATPASVVRLTAESVTRRAADAARALLRAFHRQDERAAHLFETAVSDAVTAASLARTRMATAYEVEFPWIESAQARHAGAAFVTALFLQDEIENWPRLRRRLPNERIAAALVCDPDESYPAGQATDRRWELVEAQLRSVCHATGVDPAYAERQTEFWRQHGLRRDGWEEVAHEAHLIKLRAMADETDRETLDRLARYFVAGVTRHDEWRLQSREADFETVERLVATYYQRLFDARNGGKERGD